MRFDEYLLSLAAAVVDGTSVDWTAAESHAGTAEQRQIVQQLRALASLSIAHSPIEIAGAPESPVKGPADSVPDLRDHSVIKGGRFVIDRRLGKGGFGVVYKAYDQERKTDVAVKSFNRADLGSVYDLKKEFRVLADLSHPNLVSLYELFADGDSWFITMELVRGVDFLSYVRGASEATGDRRSVPGRPSQPACDLKRLERAISQLAEALCYLHGEKKLHCDIKPSNVLLTGDGQLKLLDFGLATDVIPAVTGETIHIRGTPAYVAPELLLGERASDASDWYAVGVMLFEALTGERPFHGTFVQVLDAKQRQDALSPAAVADGIPGELDALCRDLLARRPGLRPSDTEVVLRLTQMWPAAHVAAAHRAVRTDQTPFVGRRTQIEALDTAFDASTRGEAQVVLVQGASGMGKTALVRRFLDRVRQREPDAVILEGRCYERESVPYKALDSLVDRLSRFLRHMPRAEAEALLPRDISALTRLFPILGRVDAVAEARHRPIQTADAQELRRRGFAAFRELMARLTDRHHVVVAIADLQWTDTDSAALIADLILADDPPALVFIACYRLEEAGSNTALSTPIPIPPVTSNAP